MSQAVTILNIGQLRLEMVEMPYTADNLFLAIAHQIYRFELTQENNDFYSTMFRRMCVNYLYEHHQETNLRISLTERCREVYQGVYEGNDVEMILERICNDRGFWGKKESLLSLINCHALKARVYYSDGTIETYHPHSGSPQREICLYYANGNHFSSVITIRTQQNSFPELPGTNGSIMSPEETQVHPERVQYPQGVVDPTVGTLGDSLNIGTWNISGGRLADKRDNIDLILIQGG